MEIEIMPKEVRDAPETVIETNCPDCGKPIVLKIRVVGKQLYVSVTSHAREQFYKLVNQAIDQSFLGH